MRGTEDHWRKDSFDSLRQTAELVANGPNAELYTDYVAYLGLKHQGRRKEALAMADRFVAAHQNDPFEIRQRVCFSLIELTESYWDSWPAVDKSLFPGNFGAKLLAPMFKEWRMREPKNVNAWLYRLEWPFGLEDGAETAFMLEPQNPRCQYAELSSISRYLDYVVHEFQSVGMLLASREEYSKSINSLTAVTDAMGDNLQDGVMPMIAWLQAILEVYKANEGDLRPVLSARGISDPPDYPYSFMKRWFREPPQVGGR